MVGIVWLVRHLGAADGGAARPEARRILDERFARGELSPEEYEEQRRVLR